MANLALIVGKITSFILGLFNRGSALPGKIALRISPEILRHFKFPEKVIVVTGTNGKTSTTRYIAEIFEKNGYSVMSNFKGANLHQGIVTEAINQSSLNMKIKADVAVLEVDEMTLVNLYEVLQPSEVVMTNLFPDQADRFGSVDELAKKMNAGFTSETKLILNANDPRLVWIGESHSTFEKVYYGLDKQAFNQPSHTIKCPNCGEELVYDFHFYEHIGYFHCENSDLQTPRIDVLGRDVDIESRRFYIGEDDVTIPQANVYTTFNTLAAVTAAMDAGIDMTVINDALSSVKQIKGRNETISIDGKEIHTNIAKNPAGMNQSITSVLAEASGPYSVVLAANNNKADGVSIEWFKDCQFDRLYTDDLQKIYVTGMVGQELSEELVVQGIPVDKVAVIEIEGAAKQLANDEKAEKHFIIANYTALDDLYATL